MDKTAINIVIEESKGKRSMKKRRTWALLLSAVLLVTTRGGCGAFGGKQEAGNNRKDADYEWI